MSVHEPFCVVLALTDFDHLDLWVKLAHDLFPLPGSILLRGLVSVPEDKSLSEGVLQAQQWREAFQRLPSSQVRETAQVYVDHRPMLRLLDELNTLDADLLLAQWRGPDSDTAGVPTDDILQRVNCDVVLLSGTLWAQHAPVLLSLRGGPNISLGVRVAKALAGRAGITLFHAADRHHRAPDLKMLMRTEPQIHRTVTVMSDIADSIVRESAGHKAIVLGATFHQPDAQHSAAGHTTQRIFSQVNVPVALVRAWEPEAFDLHMPDAPRYADVPLSMRVDRWFAESTFDSSEFNDLRALLTLKEKQNLRISVGLPALNEEKTVGEVIGTLRRALMQDLPLVDELVLIDSDSSDNTVKIAEALGVPVYRHREILPEVGSVAGKGEALWKSLHVLTGDIIAWVDTDITNMHPRFVYGLLGPLLRHPHVQYVKGFYRRPIRVDDRLQAYGGGRVTELVARPLLNLFYPELSGIVQPLSGEYAGRRTALEGVPFFSGYGVETGLLIDLHDKYGLEGIAQVNLEVRVHHNQPLVGLSKMSFTILQVFMGRLEARYGVPLLDRANRSMKLIIQEPERFALEIAAIADVERPPIVTVEQYLRRRQMAVK